MKVIHTVHLFLPVIGGIEHHVYELGKELVKNNWKVDVYTSSIKGAPKEEKMAGIKVRRFFTLDFPLFSSSRFPITMFFHLLFSKADVFCSHGYGSFLPFITALAAWIKRKPFIFTVHGYPKVTGKKKIFYYLYKCLLAPIILRIAKKIIIVSFSSYHELKKEVNPEKLVYIPNAVDWNVFKCKGEDLLDRNRISYIGRMDEDKNIELLIDAFQELKKEGLELMIAGKDEGIKKKLEEKTKELGVHALFAEIPYEKINEAYCNSKAIVLPSKYEGFSLVWLEGIASERPVFTTPVGDAEVIYEKLFGRDNMKLLIFKTKNELVKKMFFFLKNQRMFINMLKRARSKGKEEYTWKKVAERTRKLYLASLGGKKR